MKTKHQLILRSADIPSYSILGNLLPKYENGFPTERKAMFEDNKYKINLNQTHIVFKNINLRTLLHSDYEQTENYKIRVNNITFGLTSNGSIYSNDERDRCFNIEIQGLTFLSSTQNNNNFSDRAILATVRVPSGSTINTFSYINRDVCFMIPKHESNLTFNLSIRYLDIETNNLLPNAGLDCPYPNIQLNLSFSKY